MAVLLYAMGSVNISGIHSNNVTAADLIHRRFHFRLIEPEWISINLDSNLLFDWTVAETKARMALIAVFWFGATSSIMWKYLKRGKSM